MHDWSLHAEAMGLSVSDDALLPVGELGDGVSTLFHCEALRNGVAL